MRPPTFKLAVVLQLLALQCFAQGVFTSVDIGSQRPAGQTVTADTGFDVSSATGDIWDLADDFRFVYQAISGDFDMRVRIEGFTGAAFWSKAGLMVREDLSEFGANGFMVATRSSGWGRYMFTARLGMFYGTYVHYQGSFERVKYPNVWLRLVRVGSEVIPMHGTNGVSWTQIGKLQLNALARTAYVGMAVSNHPESGTVKATAQFRDVAVLRGAPLAPAILTQPISQTVNPGWDVTLTVTAAGRAPLTYQWFRDGAEIEGATNPAYSLQSVQKSDAGKFTCLVRNEAGEILSWAGMLEVEEASQPFDGIRSERFVRVYGRLVAYMVNATNYPAFPAAVTKPSLFEIPSRSDDTGARLQGYLTPPVTGDYTFYIAADDRGVLWLSSDDNPANKTQIAQCYYWVDSRRWDYYQSQVSVPIRLEAGRRYFLEALIKGDGSPNQGAVGWQLPDGKFERPIPVKRFYGAAAAMQIGFAPAEGLTISVGGTEHSLYVLQGTTNLIDWIPLRTNRAPFQVGGSEWPHPRGYFRAVVPR